MPFARVVDLADYIYVVFAGSPRSDDCLKPYLDRMRELYAKKKKANRKFKILYDARRIGRVKWKFVRRQLGFMREFRPVTQTLVSAIGVVLDKNDDWPRLTLRAIFKIVPPVCPVRVFQSNTLTVSRQWLEEY